MEFTKHIAGIMIETPTFSTPVPVLVEYYFFPRNISGHGHMEQICGSNSTLWNTAASFGIIRDTDLVDFVFDGVDTYTCRRVRAGVPYNDEQRFNDEDMDVLGTFRVILS